MSDEMNIKYDESIDVYYDMDIAQICQHFGKTRNTVDKAIAKLMKDYPDSGWKYKNEDTKRITIKAEGVEKLSSYFRKEKHEISTVETELRFEIEKLQAIIEEKEKASEKIESLYQERLRLEVEKSRQTLLIEQKNRDDKIKQLETEAKYLKEKNSELIEVTEQKTKLEKELSEYQKKEEEYNSKSFFYRLTHKI